jgi:uncharacterized membrane protein
LHFRAARDTDSAVKHESAIQKRIEAWHAAGLIDAATAERLATYEAAHERRTGLNWPVLIALLFGGILVAAGITLFVAAHWAEMSPAARFSVVLVLVAAFHVAGGFAAEKFPALATTFHGIGTAALGAGIFLAAQIFNLHEDWATGVLLWAVGAAIGYALLRDWVQAAFVALLAPAWLISKWGDLTSQHFGGSVPLGVGMIALALAYLSARVGDQSSLVRRVLVWIGGLTLLPVSIGAVLAAIEEGIRLYPAPRGPGIYYDWPWISPQTSAVIWCFAILVPLAIAVFLRSTAAWKIGAWIAWAAVLLVIARSSNHADMIRNLSATVAMYALLALGSAALIAWGLQDRRRERVNLGIVAFATSVLFFYFDGFMGKLGRSAGLLLLGILCLLGGYALEKTRRKLVARLESPS